MGRFLWATLIVVLATSPQHQKANPVNSPSDEQILSSLDNELLKAARTSDKEELRDLIAPEFVFEDWGGNQSATRDLGIQAIVQDWTIQRLEESSVNVRIYNDVGIVTSIVHCQGQILGKNLDIKLYLLDAWVKSGHGWRIVHSRVAPAPVQMTSGDLQDWQ